MSKDVMKCLCNFDGVDSGDNAIIIAIYVQGSKLRGTQNFQTRLSFLLRFAFWYYHSPNIFVSDLKIDMSDQDKRLIFYSKKLFA